MTDSAFPVPCVQRRSHVLRSVVAAFALLATNAVGLGVADAQGRTRARPQPADEEVAAVGQGPRRTSIGSHELVRRARALGPGPSYWPSIYTALFRLLLERAIALAAREAGITVTEVEIREELASRARKLLATSDDLLQMARVAGLTADDMTEYVRADLLLRKLTPSEAPSAAHLARAGALAAAESFLTLRIGIYRGWTDRSKGLIAARRVLRARSPGTPCEATTRAGHDCVLVGPLPTTAVHPALLSVSPAKPGELRLVELPWIGVALVELLHRDPPAGEAWREHVHQLAIRLRLDEAEAAYERQVRRAYPPWVNIHAFGRAEQEATK